MILEIKALKTPAAASISERLEFVKIPTSATVTTPKRTKLLMHRRDKNVPLASLRNPTLVPQQASLLIMVTGWSTIAKSY